MARIKTYQGSGPNPNVPFAGDVPRPQFIGQEEQAFSRLAGTIEKGALQYMEIRRKQTDTANQASADVARLEFEDAIQNDDKLYKPDGTLDTEYYREKLNSFYDNLRPNMSKDAYVQWSSRQSVMDARKISSMQSENLKRRREADKFTSTESLQLLLSNSTTGSFEDMQDAVIKGKAIIDNGLDSGIYTPQEALRLETEMPQKAAKSYIDTLVSKAQSKGATEASVNDTIDQGLAFLDADPYGIYSKDQGLKAQMIDYLSEKRLALTQKIQDNEIRRESNELRQHAKLQKINYEGYMSRLNAAYTDGVLDQAQFAEILAQASEDLDADRISITHFDRISNYNIQRAKISDQVNGSMALSDPSNPAHLDRIKDPNYRRKIRTMSLNIPMGYADEVQYVQQYDKRKSTEIQMEYATKSAAFDDLIQDPRHADKIYDKSDLRAVFAFKYYLRNNPTKFYTEFLPSYRESLSSRGFGDDEDIQERIRTLQNSLENYISETNNKRVQTLNNIRLQEKSAGQLSTDRQANPNLIQGE